MKSKEEIQKMHDVISFLCAHPLLLKDVATELDEERLLGALNVLCWTLGHNEKMDLNLDDILQTLSKYGVTLEFIQAPENQTKINGRPHLN